MFPFDKNTFLVLLKLIFLQNKSKIYKLSKNVKNINQFEKLAHIFTQKHTRISDRIGEFFRIKVSGAKTGGDERVRHKMQMKTLRNPPFRLDCRRRKSISQQG